MERRLTSTEDITSVGELYLDADGIRRLLASISLQAYKDLLWAYRTLRKERKRVRNEEWRLAIRYRNECEYYFKSDNPFLMNFDGPVAIEKAKEQAEKGVTYDRFKRQEMR